jgi:UDP-3-O-[3-hydroxymyristoyl] glucosamine N-acyltransferase
MPTLADIASVLGVAPPAGAAPDQPIRGVASVDDAGPHELSFVTSDQYARQLPTTKAGAVVLDKRVHVPPEATPTGATVIVVEDAELAVAKVLALFAPPVPRPPTGVDPAARLASSAKLGDGCAIGPSVFVGERVVLGRRVTLHPGVYVGDDVTIGDDCQFFPNVVIRERITIGHRVTIHAGSVLGSDGFGYRWDGTKHAKVPQIGTVIVEDDVEIGSCVCIDRAKFSATVVGRGTKIDNLVQVGHNVRIGPHCIIVGQAAMAGSSTLGTGVVLGGQTAVRDHIVIGDGAMAAACSAIAQDVPPKAIVSGTPALPHRQSLREQAALRHLPDLVVQVRKLKERLDQLEKGHG